MFSIKPPAIARHFFEINNSVIFRDYMMQQRLKTRVARLKSAFFRRICALLPWIECAYIHIGKIRDVSRHQHHFVMQRCCCYQ